MLMLGVQEGGEESEGLKDGDDNQQSQQFV